MAVTRDSWLTYKYLNSDTVVTVLTSNRSTPFAEAAAGATEITTKDVTTVTRDSATSQQLVLTLGYRSKLALQRPPESSRTQWPP